MHSAEITGHENEGQKLRVENHALENDGENLWVEKTLWKMKKKISGWKTMMQWKATEKI